MQASESYKNDRAAAQFIDVVGDSMRSEFLKSLTSANYYSVLTDGSTDASVMEQEVVYVLFMSEEGEPVVKFLSIETPEHAHADGLKQCIEEAFQKIGIVPMYKQLSNLNVDGASVNTGLHNGLGVKMKESAPWLSTIHCFNHCLELAVKDTFDKTFFKEVDNMLLKLFYLYRKSPKRLRELKVFGEIYEQSVPKPYKSYGTRWISHKVQAMEVVLRNYGIYMKHLESLAHTDSQALKRAEIQGEAKKWQNAKFLIHLAIYLDVLAPLKALSLGFQNEKHDPVFALRRITEFNWTMAKLQLLIDDSLDGGNGERLTNYTRLLKDVVYDDNTKEYMYQDIKLQNFNIQKNTVDASYREIITRLASSMEDRFINILESPAFKHLIAILDTKLWPSEEAALASYCDEEIGVVRDHYNDLLMQNGCDVSLILKEWDMLKIFIKPMVNSSPKPYYLNVWKNVFTNEDIRKDCRNVLHIIELLLITPFTNAKLERVFSRMNRVKTDSRNRLSQKRLDTSIRVSEEGVEISKFNPDPYIQKWYGDKVRCIKGAKSKKYPQKRKSVASSSFSDVMMIASYTLSDLESEEEYED